MSNKKIFVAITISIIGSVAGYIFVNHYDFGLCQRNLETNVFDVGCSNLYKGIGDPLLYGMSALAVVFLALLFAPRAWGAWKKFAIWFVPLAALLFIFYRGPGSGDLFSPDPEFVFKWTSIIYVVVSLVIIALAASKRRK